MLPRKRGEGRRWSVCIVGAATASITLALAIVLALAVVAPRTEGMSSSEIYSGTCAPLDVAIVLDTSTSMDPAIDNVKAGLASLLDTIDEASGGDYRVGLVDFGAKIGVHVNFSERNAAEIQEAIGPLRQVAGNVGNPEAWDEALDSVITLRPASEIGIQRGTFTGPWRDDAEKLIILVSDALPAGDNDSFEQTDLGNALDLGALAAENDIRIASIFVPNGNDQGEPAAAALESTARESGGSFFETTPDGGNIADGIDLVVSACAKDADSDGLYDIWETKGYDADGDGKIDVDLPAMGADPEHKDLFVEVGWMVPNGSKRCLLFWCYGAGEAPHTPSREALERVVDAFAASPMTNPDGENGIDVHFDAGAYTPRGGVPPEQRVEVHLDHADYAWRRGERYQTAFARLYDAYPAERAPLFTFASYVHEIEPRGEDGDYGPSGLASGMPGDSVMVAEDAIESDTFEAITLFHELGHTLGLGHGGGDSINGKPNYLSVMNYDHALTGGLKVGGQTIIDYSRWEVADLDERGTLDEGTGISAMASTGSAASAADLVEPEELPTDIMAAYHCDPNDPEARYRKWIRVEAPVDWNCDGDTNDHVRDRAVHQYDSDIGDTRPTLLESQNDWAALDFRGGLRGALPSKSSPIPDQEAGLTEEAWRQTPKDYELRLSGPGAVSGDASSGPIILPFTVENIGTLDDSYEISANYSDPAGNRVDLEYPRGLSLASGESGSIVVEAPLPEVATGSEAMVTLTARSKNLDTATAAELATITIAAPAERVADGDLDIVPNPVKPGSSLTVSGDGFAPNAPIALRIEGEGWKQPPSGTSDSDGAASFELEASDIEQFTQFEMLGPSGGTGDIGPANVEPQRLHGEIHIRGQGPIDKKLIAAIAAAALVFVSVVVIVLWRRRRNSGEEAESPPPVGLA